MSTNKLSRNLWIIILILFLVFFVIILLLPLEAYLGVNAPFVIINNTNFNIFGMEFAGYEEQLGIMLMCGVLMMAIARLISLAIIKIMN